jgi:D-alanine-D-alanine ligase
VAEGTGKGIAAGSKVFYTSKLAGLTQSLLDRYAQPVLVECFLPGREFTVGILGTGSEAEALGALELTQRKRPGGSIYSFEAKENCEELVEYTLATGTMGVAACRTALDAWKALECRDAGRVDLRADEYGDLSVLELNPLAGLHPTHSDLPMLCTAVGVPYVELIARIMYSACKRHGLVPAPVAGSAGGGM